VPSHVDSLTARWWLVLYPIRCEAFRAGRLQSLDRFKVEEDRSKEELDEEEALAKRLKLAFKAAKVMAAKKKEQKAKYVLYHPCTASPRLVVGVALPTAAKSTSLL
jgi:hypothetical protein